MQIKQNEIHFTEIDERLPIIQSGLIHHMPMDGKAGAFDTIGGLQSKENIENNVNLIEAMDKDWRDPSSWGNSSSWTWDAEKQAMRVAGYHNSWLQTPIIIDPNKEYQLSCEVYFEEAANGGFYMGGYATNKAGERVTTNYDYTMSSNYNENDNLNKWITFKVTRTGTATRSNGTRFSFDTVVGWTGERTDITDKLTYHYYFGALWNYNGSGVLYFRNPKIEIVDNDVSNTLVNNNGISTVNAFTNRWRPLDGTRGWIHNYGATTTAITDYTAPDPNDVIKSWKPLVDSEHGTKGHWNGTWGTHNFLPAANDKFTIGCYYKVINDTRIPYSFNLLNSSWAANYSYVRSQKVIQIDNEWYFKYAVVNATNAEDCRPYIDYSYDNATEIYTSGMFCIDGQRPIPVGTRDSGSKSILTYENMKDLDTYTVCGHFIPYTPFENSYDMTENQSTLVSIKNLAGKGMYYRFYLSGGTTSSPFLDIDDNMGTPYHAHVSGTYIDEHVPAFWSFTKSGSSVSLKLYQHNKLVSTHSSTLSDSAYCRLGSITFGAGASAIWDCEQQGLSIYNRVLSDSELLKLASTPMSFHKEYEVVPKINEVDKILSDCYYNPLTGDNGNIEPVKATDCIYTPEGVYVQNGYTNLAGDFSTWSSQRNYKTKLKTPYGDGFKYTSGALNSTWSNNSYGYMYKNVSGTTVGQNYFFGVWVYLSEDCGLTALPITGEVGITGSKSYDMSKKGTWQYIYRQFTVNTAGDSRFLVYPRIEGQGVTDGSFEGYFIVTQPTIIQTDITNTLLNPGSFTSNNITEAHLHFNLNTTLDLYWSNDWSISYWKKPIATHTNNLTGYNIESIGSNSNSVGGGYTWFGKASGSNTIASATGSYGNTIVPDEYFNKWQFVSMVKTGTTIVTKTWLDNGKLYNRSTGTTNSVANYYVNQYGYDFKLGGWDDVNNSNTIFKDLRVFKRAISTEEEETLRNLKFRVYKEKSIVNSSISEF